LRNAKRKKRDIHYHITLGHYPTPDYDHTTNGTDREQRDTGGTSLKKRTIPIAKRSTKKGPGSISNGAFPQSICLQAGGKNQKEGADTRRGEAQGEIRREPKDSWIRNRVTK